MTVEEHCFLLTDAVNALHYGDVVEHFAKGLDHLTDG